MIGLNGIHMLIAVVFTAAVIHKILIPIWNKLYRLNRIEKALKEDTLKWLEELK